MGTTDSLHDLVNKTLNDLISQNPFRTLEEKLAQHIRIRKDPAGPQRCTTFTGELQLSASISVDNTVLAQDPERITKMVHDRLVDELLVYLFSDRRKVLSAITSEILDSVTTLLSQAEATSGVLPACRLTVDHLRHLVFLLLTHSGVCAPPPSVSSKTSTTFEPEAAGTVPATSTNPSMLDETDPIHHLNAFHPVIGRGSCTRCGAEIRTMTPPYRPSAKSEHVAMLAEETLKVCEEAASRMVCSANWSADPRMIHFAAKMSHVLSTLHQRRRFSARWFKQKETAL